LTFAVLVNNTIVRRGHPVCWSWPFLH